MARRLLARRCASRRRCACWLRAGHAPAAREPAERCAPGRDVARRGGAAVRWAGRWRATLGIGRWSNGVRHTMAHVGRTMCDCAALVARKIVVAAPPAGHRSGESPTMS
ncbi:hypothetical protein F511_47445 [Dorcoceras hygrometricum]|uniref:Uncharacterized protein n=1 Tax=Dorcoceras hygrometricum TaxID=472368 RepID=A0A2Z6ZY88_9LAMI|nr:hypothetical protein F511_47445 [Dorcoceras hygrometricum]